VDQKISALSDAFTYLKKELEVTTNSIKSVSTRMVQFSDNAILTTKPMNPNMCLSCGNEMQGVV